MKLWQRGKINPVEFVKGNYNFNLLSLVADPDKINITVEYDNTLTKRNSDYCIRRQQSHDGTLLFTYGLILSPINLVLSGQSCCKKYENADLSEVKGVHYTIGDMSLITTWKDDGKGLRQRERVSLPVKMQYIY